MVPVATLRDPERVDLDVKHSIQRNLLTLDKLKLELLNAFASQRGSCIRILPGRKGQSALLARDGNCIRYRPWVRGEPRQWEAPEWGESEEKLDSLVGPLLAEMASEAQREEADRKQKLELCWAEIKEEQKQRDEHLHAKLSVNDPLFIARNNRAEISLLRERIEALETALEIFDRG